MIRVAAGALLLAIAAGCAQDEPEPVQQQPGSTYRRLDQKPPDDSADRASVVSLARGSVITSRTGEALLELSALRAIDGDPVSAWTSPPEDLPQSMTVALAARARIDRVGFRNNEQIPVKTVTVESSTDGVTFKPLKTIVSAETRDAQWFDIAPVEVTHLRYSMIDTPSGKGDARIASVLARGTELEPPKPGDVTGCWSINGLPARFDRKGARITGVATLGRLPLQLDGGFDGRVYRLNWIRGNDYGYVLMTVSPDARHMTAFEWHEEAIALFFGESWFAERKPCGNTTPFDPETAKKFLHRTGRFSLFGIAFREDGSIDRERSASAIDWLVRFLASAPQSRFVAHEYRRANAQENRTFAQRELDALRAELQHAGAKLEGVGFVAAGSDAPRQLPDNESMRAIYSTVDLEIRR